LDTSPSEDVLKRIKKQQEEIDETDTMVNTGADNALFLNQSKVTIESIQELLLQARENVEVGDSTCLF
jgi:hypothetical protein